jgi:hypothetical protein
VKPAKDLKTKLSLIDPQGKIHIEPLAILDRRIVKKKMHALVEVLVQWSSMNNEKSIWKNIENLCQQFPICRFEDKYVFKEGIITTQLGQ